MAPPPAVRCARVRASAIALILLASAEVPLPVTASEPLPREEGVPPAEAAPAPEDTVAAQDAVAVGAGADGGEVAPPPAQALNPRSNETMEFSVSYLGLPVGKARLFVGRVEPNVAPVFLQAQTSSVLSFVTIRQQLASYLDRETGLPRSGTLDAIEGSYRHNDTVQFDRATNKATVRVKGRYDNTYQLDIPPGTVDFVGLVFKLRGLPLDLGTRHEFPVLAGRHLKTVVAEVVARETVSTKAGEFSALKVRVPTGFNGKFSEKNPTHVWFSDDDRRIVVRITTDFSIGHATAGLVSYAPGLPAQATVTP